jgi:hypothetical protein
MQATGAATKTSWLFRQKNIFTPESFLQMPVTITPILATTILNRKSNPLLFSALLA